MTRFLQAALLLLIMLSLPTRATESPEPRNALLIFSATDEPAISPLLQAFRAQHPHVRIDYREFNTMELDQQVRSRSADQQPDLVISSAMDLQIKLVNDGYARRFDDGVLDSLPSWARWRHEAFGFSYEPIVFVYNKAAFSGRPLPRTHDALATAMRNDSEFFQYRVGSYDVRSSGVGYLVATQDEVASSLSGRLQESLGRSFTQVYCCTAQILDDIAQGKLVLGYNMLGSYALARAENDPRLGVIVPEDYALVVSRVAFITKAARNPLAAETFLRFLLSTAGQQVMAANGALVALHPDVEGPFSIQALKQSQATNFHPIGLGPALMVYLDQAKRRRFIEAWENALLPDVAVP